LKFSDTSEQKGQNMWVAGYEYETAHGATIRKAVICETWEEYLRIWNRIKDAEEKGTVKMIEFVEAMKSETIL